MRTKMCFDNDENEEKLGEDTMASDETLVNGTLSNHHVPQSLASLHWHWTPQISVKWVKEDQRKRNYKRRRRSSHVVHQSSNRKEENMARGRNRSS